MIFAAWELFTPDNLLIAGRTMAAVGWVLVKIGGLIIILV